MIEVLKIKLVGGGIYVQPIGEIGVLIDEIKEADIDSVWHIEKKLMSQKNYEKLDEFTGH